MTKWNFISKILGLALLLIAINNQVLAQNLAWELVNDGSGVSDHQELVCFDFKAGSGLTSFEFSSSGASAKQWTTGGIDIHDYFEVSFASYALDTFVLKNLSYGERRSGTSIRTYQIRYSTKSDFSEYTALNEVTVPDNDSERDTTIQNMDVLILPQDTFYIRWYGYNAESSTWTWRINDNTLEMSLETYINDVTAPVLNHAFVVDSRTIQMDFDEQLDTASFQTSDFSIDGQLNPIAIDKSLASQGRILLQFEDDMPLEQAINLSYESVADIKGNTITSGLAVELFYYLPQSFYVIIDEIMSDPNPQVYLPEVEYIELYNTKSFPIQLKDWELQINSSTYAFPEVQIGANAYLLIIPEDTDSLFSDTLPTVELFSDGKITNSEGNIIIRDENGAWIHQVDYTENWHTESYKKDGGWSFEMIDKNSPCNMLDNWSSSISNTGGTPASINSIDGEMSSEIELEILNAYFPDSASIVLEFNQFLSPAYIPDASKFSIDAHIATSANYNIGEKEMLIEFNTVFETNIVYDLKIEDSLLTCSDLILDLPFEKRIGIPVLVDTEDIVFNEVFFNPEGSHKTYIEFINTSEKILDLQEMKLGIVEDDGIAYKSNLYTNSKLIFPGDYFVLTKDREDVLNQFLVKDKDCLFETEELPSISTTEDRLILANKGDLKIDEIYYSSDYHNPILADNEGVALERINPDIPALNANAWQSASEASGYGTPTDINSQYSDLKVEEVRVFSLESESFSPDMDGYHDYLIINYQLEKSGYAASVEIYNSKGQKIIDLVDNELTGKTGHWTWDGRDQNGTSADLGIYILVFELIHADGDIINEKKVCTLAGKL